MGARSIERRERAVSVSSVEIEDVVIDSEEERKAKASSPTSNIRRTGTMDQREEEMMKNLRNKDSQIAELKAKLEEMKRGSERDPVPLPPIQFSHSAASPPDIC